MSKAIPQALLMLLLAGSPTAANPYLALGSGEPLVSQWSGSEWGDRIKAPTEEGRPLSATVTSRRLAQMPWGQIVRMRFDAEGGREIAPIYLLVRDEVILELATDEWVVARSWPDKGLELGMVAGGQGGPWSLGSISAKAPCRLATAGGIRVGSFEADVKAAYGKVRSAEDSVPGQYFVAGSIFGGVIFDLKEGVVTRIFVGAAAE